ncbi:MAG: replicative DNA helicase [Pseudomonadota bacterium]
MSCNFDYPNVMPKDHETTQTEAPNNLVAEAAVLGAILFDNNAYQRVTEVLQPTDYYAPAHQEIYATCAALIEQGRLADGVTLREHFERNDQLTVIGGAAYLAELLDSAAFGPEVTDYARIVRDLAIRRELLNIGSGMKLRALVPPSETEGSDQIELAERELFALAERGSSNRGFVDFGSAVRQSLEMAEAAFQREGKIAGIATHLDDLDYKLGGLHNSDLLILAGRPSMGKTSLATNIAYNVAAACRREKQEDGSLKSIDGGVVAFFSLEMSSEQLATRIIAERTGISGHKFRSGELDERDFERIRDAVTELQNLPLHIDDTGGLSISQLAARARRLHRTVGLDMIVIDYLQLITSSGGKSDGNRVQEITQISMALKALAKDLDIPVIALSQLSRQVEQRDDKRPQLSDLRESGSIEQDADVVMFVYRDEYYLSRMEPQPGEGDGDTMSKWQQWRERMDNAMGKAEVIIGKQRHGPIGKVELAFDAEVTRFGNLEKSRTEEAY